MIAFAGALFSKEQGVMTPFLFVLADLLGMSNDPPGRSATAWARRYWPAALIAGVFFAIRVALFGGAEYVAGALSGPALSLLYAVESVFAPTLALVYEPTVSIWLSPLRLAFGVFAGAAIVFMVHRDWAGLKRQAWFWLGWFVLTLLPTANLLRQEARFDERYVFLAAFAVFAIAAPDRIDASRFSAYAPLYVRRRCCAGRTLRRHQLSPEPLLPRRYRLQPPMASLESGIGECAL